MPSNVTQLLHAHQNGDESALNKLTELLYPELKMVARKRSSKGLDLGATTLVHETFARLLAGGELKPTDREQFFSLSATIMRQIVIDQIRYLNATKRGGKEVTFADSNSPDKNQERVDFLLQVDQAINALENQDARAARVFECRYFMGLTTKETAENLNLSVRSTERLWTSARKKITQYVSGGRPSE